MRVSVVTRRGTNAYHGRLFEDFRNTSLNANSWSNNARGLPRGILKRNEFGASVGGPVLKNKLFFFGTFSESIQPISNSASATVLSPGAQQGIFSYRDASGALQSINVLQAAGAAGLPSTVNSRVAVSRSKTSSGYSQGALTATNDPNLYTLNFQTPRRDTIYYPTIRVDWNASESLRFFLSYGQTKTNRLHNYPPQF